MRFNPHDYQKYAIDRIIHDKAIALWLKPGLGKTAITLMAIRYLMYMSFEVKKVLVIAPKKVAESTWPAECAKWDETAFLTVSLVLGTLSQRERALAAPADIYVINRDNVKWIVDHYKNDWPFDMVVIDESSSFKSHRTKRFKALASIRPHIKRIVELTGTPRPNTLLDLWAQIYLLDGGERLGRTFSGFRERYFNPGVSRNGIVYNYVPKNGSEARITALVKDICVTMSDEDYLQLPDLVYNDIRIELSAAGRKKYDTLEREMVLALPDGDITTASAAALSNKLLQLANGAVYDEDRGVHEVHTDKIDAFLELIESLNGESALVFYSFLHDRDRLLTALSKTDKEVKLLEGPADVTDWNSGNVDILLTHPASSAYGLNLQTGGRHIIWFGLTWNYEHYYQAIKRLHRQGQPEPVIVHHLICNDTRDIDVLRALHKKEAGQEAMMESLKARIDSIRHDR